MLPDAGVSPPSGNTGGIDGLFKHPFAVSLDWLNFTFVCHPDQTPQFIEDELTAAFGFAFEDGRGLHGYERTRRSAKTGAIIAFGGISQRGTCWVSLPGGVFGSCNRESYAWLEVLLHNINATITRVDLCVDFFEGEVSVLDCVSWYGQDVYKLGRVQPSCSVVGDWIGGKNGRTFYVGKARNGKLIRCYEKGIQLGDPQSKWVRIELQLGNVDRSIPLDVLSFPERYFGGAAKWPFAVFGQPLRIKTRIEREAIVYGKLMNEARRAYGKLVTYCLANGMPLDEISAELALPGFPRRLNGPTEAELRAEANFAASEVHSDRLQIQEQWNAEFLSFARWSDGGRLEVR